MQDNKCSNNNNQYYKYYRQLSPKLIKVSQQITAQDKYHCRKNNILPLSNQCVKSTQLLKKSMSVIKFDYQKLAEIDLANSVKQKIKDQQKHIKKHIQKKKKENMIHTSMNKMIQFTKLGKQNQPYRLSNFIDQDRIYKEKTNIVNSYKSFTFDNDSLHKQNNNFG